MSFVVIIMNKTGHQFTQKDNTNDTDNNNTNCDKDTDHRNKRQRTTTEEITKSENRPDQLEHKDDHDDEDQTNEDDTVLSEVHIHPDNGLVDRRTITSTFLLSRKGQPILESQQESCLDNSISMSNSIMVQDDDQENDKDVHDEELDLWDCAVEIRHAMGTDLRGVGKSVCDKASNLPRYSSFSTCHQFFFHKLTFRVLLLLLVSI